MQEAHSPVLNGNRLEFKVHTPKGVLIDVLIDLKMVSSMSAYEVDNQTIVCLDGKEYQLLRPSWANDLLKKFKELHP